MLFVTVILICFVHYQYFFSFCCRWAVKQEDLKNIGQWKNSTIRNPEWNKRALSWPVNEDGKWNMVRERITCHDLSLLKKNAVLFIPFHHFKLYSNSQQKAQ